MNELRTSTSERRLLHRVSRILTPLVPAVTLLVLGTFAMQHWSHAGEAISKRDASAVPWALDEALPVSQGPWVGEPWPAINSGRPLLREVERRGRVYEHIETGRRVAVLLVRAEDWRDLRGYALPQWYTDAGWRVLDRRQATWRVHRTRLPVMEYELSAPGRRGPSGASLGEADGQLTVSSFLVDADGGLRRTFEAESIDAPPLDRGLRAGVATLLVHVAFAGDVPAEERQSAIEDLMRALILPIERDSDDGGGQS